MIESEIANATKPVTELGKARGKMKIMVVDDHALFRQGLAMLLSELYPRSEILEAGSSAAALELAERHKDVKLVLIDLKLADGGGLETVEKLAAGRPDTAVAIVSGSEDISDIARSYKAGAKGYIVKSSTSEVLRHALPLMLSGETYIPSHAIPLLTGGGRTAEPTVRRPVPAEAPRMTPRQQQILLLMAQGMQNRDIAESLGMLEGTVKVHVKSVLQKLGVNNRTHAVVVGLRTGLVPSELVLPQD